MLFRSMPRGASIETNLNATNLGWEELGDWANWIGSGVVVTYSGDVSYGHEIPFVGGPDDPVILLSFDFYTDEYLQTHEIFKDGNFTGGIGNYYGSGGGNEFFEAYHNVAFSVHPVSELVKVSEPKTDVPSDWAVEEINAAIEAGLVPEHIQKNYTQPVSRGNVAQMYINFIEKYSGNSIDEFLTQKGVSINTEAFTDTNNKAVLAANALGIIKGVGDGKFEPDGTFTRAHVAAILNRIASVLGIDTAGYTHSFTDVTGHWVDAELGWPVHVGIIIGVGDNKFEPDTHLTTEQVIAATYRAMQILSK